MEGGCGEYVAAEGSAQLCVRESGDGECMQGCGLLNIYKNNKNIRKYCHARFCSHLRTHMTKVGMKSYMKMSNSLESEDELNIHLRYANIKIIRLVNRDHM